MKLRLCTRLFDDLGQECKEGDTVLLQTTSMNTPINAVITALHTTCLTIVYDDILMGYQEETLRPIQIKKCIKQ